MLTHNKPRAFAGEASPVVVDLHKGSKDHAAMAKYWSLVGTLISGTDAVIAAGETFLPRLPNEGKKDYEFRLGVAKFTNIYRDIVENLASKPFVTPVTVPNAPGPIEEFIKDVDGSGRNLTTYAADMFFNGISDAIDWLFVDFPNVDPNEVRTIADEKKAGVRPFWSRILAANMLEVRSAVHSGKEVLTYARIYEPDVAGDDYVRIMERDAAGARWTLWKAKPTNGRAGANTPREFEQVGAGVFSIGVLPLVPFVTGRRNGRKWVFHPPMRDAADLQKKLYQDESGLDYIKTMAAYPMLAGNGVSPPKKDAANANSPVERAPVGPMAVLYAPPDGKGGYGNWALLEPAASSLTFLKEQIKDTIVQLRELGRQPLTANSGNLTVITTTVAAQKGNSAVQSWAFILTNVIIEALKLTALWMKVDYADPKVTIFTDFDVDGEGGETLTALGKMRDGGDLSQRTLWKEMQRRNVLAPDFDADEEEKALLTETPGDDEELDAFGNPVPPKPDNDVVPPTGAPKPPVDNPAA